MKFEEGDVVRHKISKKDYLVVDNHPFNVNWNKIKVKYWKEKRDKFKYAIMNQNEFESK